MQNQAMDPFLLPMCSACGGPTSLSRVEPFPSGDVADLRTYQCPRCDKSESIPVRRSREHTHGRRRVRTNLPVQSFDAC